jgi:hypothetical protein
MRPYPRNSPQAAGRLLALALMADGDVSSVELSRLEDLMAHNRLGLGRPAWLRVLHDFCADLLQCRRRTRPGTGADDGGVDATLLDQLLADLDDPTLCETVLTLCREAVEADRVVTDGEAAVLAAAAQQWGLRPGPCGPALPEHLAPRRRSAPGGQQDVGHLQPVGLGAAA